MHQHPFWDLVSGYLGTLRKLSVHPASPILLTKNGPLGSLTLVASAMKTPAFRAHLEFENKLRSVFPKTSNHVSTGRCSRLPAILRETSRLNQLLDSSMSLSPLYPDLTSDLHVNTASNVHQVFTWLPSAQEKLAIFRVSAVVLYFTSLSHKIKSVPRCSQTGTCPVVHETSHFHCGSLGLSP